MTRIVRPLVALALVALVTLGLTGLASAGESDGNGGWKVETSRGNNGGGNVHEPKPPKPPKPGHGGDYPPEHIGCGGIIWHGHWDKVHGHGFLEGIRIIIVIHLKGGGWSKVLGETVVGEDGSFELPYVAPDEVGDYTITASSGEEEQTTDLAVVEGTSVGDPGDPTAASTPSDPTSAVQGTATAAPVVVTAGTLPYTGSESSIPLVEIGAGLVAAGAVTVLAVRRHKQRPA